jgi:hypothetical protein
MRPIIEVRLEGAQKGATAAEAAVGSRADPTGHHFQGKSTGRAWH